MVAVRSLLFALSLLLAGPVLAQEDPVAETAETGEEPIEVFRLRLAHELDQPLDLEQVKDELKLEMESFEESGVVSVEGGAACLDAPGSDGQSGPSENVTPRIEVERTTLKVKVIIPRVRSVP